MALPRHTERLLIREYTIADLHDVLAVIGDPRVFWWRAKPYDEHSARMWLEEAIVSRRERSMGRYAVQLCPADDASAVRGRVIGGVSLLPRHVAGTVEIEIGWHMRADLWGRGYATEAAGALVAEARARGLRRLAAFIVPGNGASRAVARKLGLATVGELQWAGQPHELWSLDLV